MKNKWIILAFVASILAGLLAPAQAQTNNPLGIGNALSLPPANVSAPAVVNQGRVVAASEAVAAAEPQKQDYKANLGSDVFGAQLFTGAFSRQGATQFNPDYAVAIGDRIQVRLWGAFDFDQALTVDPRGNIFIPHAGPVNVLGVRNQELQRVVERAIARTFRNNVSSYASLAAAQPVRVFVGGFVNRPGLYSGTSMDSLLYYLDQAGGIDAERGSFLHVEVRRGAQVRLTANLYDFLLNGNMPLVQLSDGDVIFVAPRRNSVKIGGLVANAKRFEFAEDSLTVADFMRMAKPQAAVTHVRVRRNTGAVRSVEYFPLASAETVRLFNGDELEFTADKKAGTITVRVEGEHESAQQEYVLPYGARMGDLLGQLAYSDRSDREGIQLYRLSVKDRQKQMLATALKSLEAAALTARSGTSDEARLRKEESDLILQWVERAKQVDPSGQVVIAQAGGMGNLLLENGDTIRIPTKDGLVLISGEVLFPNAVAFDPSLSVADYVGKAGGYTQNADAARIVIARRDGSFVSGETGGGFWGASDAHLTVREGDEIFVLPKIDVKSRQIWKDITQIIYQIAVSAKVVLGL